MLNKINNLIENFDKNEISYKKMINRFKDGKFEKLFAERFPFTERYFFEGNPSFSYEYKDVFDMGRYPVIMLRDGFLGILDFFLTHPKPSEDMSTNLLIPKQFEGLVPTFWKDRVALYEVKTRKVAFEKSKTLFVHGVGVEETFWKNPCETLYAGLEEKISQFDEIHCFFPTRTSTFSLPKDRFVNFHIDLLKHSFKTLGNDINVHETFDTYNTALKASDKFSFFNVDKSKVFISDNFIDHLMLKLGGEDLRDQIESHEEKLEFNLSLNHKIEITNVDFSKSVFNNFYLKQRLKGRKSDASIYKLFLDADVKKEFEKQF